MTEKDLTVAAPNEAEICAALDRVLASTHFRAAPQLSSFLRFVIEKTLVGRADRIKGYDIAVGALGRGDNFDPQTDPIVRVEAGRLRRALQAYYAGPGRHDEIVIKLPLGSYIPTFERRRIDSNLRNSRARAPRSVWRRYGLAAFAASAAAAASLALYVVIIPAGRTAGSRVTPFSTFAGPCWTVTALLFATTVVSIILAWWISRN
jgi:hypothetical protein